MELGYKGVAVFSRDHFFLYAHKVSDHPGLELRLPDDLGRAVNRWFAHHQFAGLIRGGDRLQRCGLR